MPIDPVSNPQLPSTTGATRSYPGDSSWREFPESSRRAHDEPSWSDSTDSSTAAWPSMATGLVAGACLGAAVALLFAPMRGSAMRSSVRSYATQGGERLSRLIEDGRSLAGDAAQRAGSLIDQGRRAFRTADRDRPAHDAGSQPLTASVADIAGRDRRFEEPLGG